MIIYYNVQENEGTYDKIVWSTLNIFKKGMFVTVHNYTELAFHFNNNYYVSSEFLLAVVRHDRGEE